MIKDIATLLSRSLLVPLLVAASILTGPTNPVVAADDVKAVSAIPQEVKMEGRSIEPVKGDAPKELPAPVVPPVVPKKVDDINNFPDFESMTNQEYIDYMYPMAKQVYDETGILPSVTIGQAIWESGWGKSAIGYNFFGMTADCGRAISSKKQATTCGYTQTYGKCACHPDGFSKTKLGMYYAYPTSYTEGIKLRSMFMLKAHYAKACSATTYRGQIQAMQNAGYAGDQSYVSHIVSAIESYDLHSYDPGGVNFK